MQNTLLTQYLTLLVNSTQLLVTSDENVKFEVSGVTSVQGADPLDTAQTNHQTQPQKPCEYEKQVKTSLKRNTC